LRADGEQQASGKIVAGGDTTQQVGLVNRERCWNARDAYHACLRDPQKVCDGAFSTYASACPRSWLLHFEKRRKLEEERQARAARS